MSSNEFTKDPDALLDYMVDWTKWLGTDTISLSTWIVPTGITKHADANTTTTATIELLSGTKDNTYEVVNRIDTDGGRINDQTIIIHIKDK